MHKPLWLIGPVVLNNIHVQYRWMVMLHFICIGSAALWGTGSKPKLQNENTSIFNHLTTLTVNELLFKILQYIGILLISTHLAIPVSNWLWFGVLMQRFVNCNMYVCIGKKKCIIFFSNSQFQYTSYHNQIWYRHMHFHHRSIALMYHSI